MRSVSPVVAKGVLGLVREGLPLLKLLAYSIYKNTSEHVSIIRQTPKDALSV